MKKLMRKWISVAVMVLAFLFLLAPKVAWAADATAAAAGPTVLQTFMDQFFAIVLPVLSVVLGALVTGILKKVLDRFHVTVAKTTLDAWSQLASSAALRGAEWARQKTKDLVGDKKVPGEDILDVAVNWATQMAEAHGLPELAREKLVGLIESELFKLRLTTADPAAAATTTTTVTPTEPYSAPSTQTTTTVTAAAAKV